MAERIRRALEGWQSLAWAVLILTLPITSVPVLARLSGASTVAPLATLPLVWLLVVWLLPYLWRRGGAPRLALPFLAFVAITLIATLSATFIEIPSFKGVSPQSQQLEALVTLAVGASFYVVAAIWPRSEGRLTLTFRLINLSGLALLLWSGLQAYGIWFNDRTFPDFMIRVQEWLSVNRLFRTRVNGFAYEPSWLAHQLNILYLPYWLAATVRGASVHRFRLGPLTVENILLGGGALILLASFSRVGMLAFLLVLTYLILRGGLAWTRRLAGGLVDRLSLRGALARVIRVGTSLGLAALVFAGFVGGAVGLVYGLSQLDERLANLFDPELFAGGGFFMITNRLAFAERVVYWATGWQIFNDHPLLGVGAGNAGFFFPEKMPAFGWALWEINQIFFRLSFIPNTKSLWVRILAESGLIGFAFFLAWYFVLWKSARLTARYAGGLPGTAAEAGQLVLIAFLIEGFSIDSYALPYLWFSLGLLTAVVVCYRRGLQPEGRFTALPPPAAAPAGGD